MTFTDNITTIIESAFDPFSRFSTETAPLMLEKGITILIMAFMLIIFVYGLKLFIGRR